MIENTGNGRVKGERRLIQKLFAKKKKNTISKLCEITTLHPSNKKCINAKKGERIIFNFGPKIMS